MPQTQQRTSVFTYLVSEIGETRDTKRFAIEENDLHEAVELFNQFKGSPDRFISRSPRCKCLDMEAFDKKTNWMADRWWTSEEKIALGIEAETTEISEDDFCSLLMDAQKIMLSLYEEMRSEI
jgi:hypothetical protein